MGSSYLSNSEIFIKNSISETISQSIKRAIFNRTNYIRLHTLQVEDEKFVQISGKIASLARWLLQVVRRPFSISSFYNSIRLTSNSSFPIFSHLQYLIYSSIWFKPLVFTIHSIPNLQLTTTYSIPNLQLHSVNTSIFPFTFTFQFQLHSSTHFQINASNLFHYSFSFILLIIQYSVVSFPSGDPGEAKRQLFETAWNETKWGGCFVSFGSLFSKIHTTTNRTICQEAFPLQFTLKPQNSNKLFFLLAFSFSDISVLNL